ncbi:MAG: 30S ribosomal protein S17 [Candidatus Micrarchaeota archaeon]|nr:MAG: 30S ribosomal protein S17 [Candidatus Micrarchaeota archaeon]
MEACNDPKCPVHGNLKTHGDVIVGKVRKIKVRKTAVIDVDYIIKVQKYERFIKKTSHIKAYVPDCMKVKEGDLVQIQQTRRLSKTKSFVVTNVLE